MAREVMERRASDNVYLHKDFHGALSAGIEYLEKQYGEEAVREYLRRFTLSYYAPLRKDIEKRGLIALKEHFEKMYRREGTAVEIRFTGEELVLSVASCPAVTHMRAGGYPVARLFSETTRTVNETLCEGTPFAAELIFYDEATGKSIQRFSPRHP